MTKLKVALLFVGLFSAQLFASEQQCKTNFTVEGSFFKGKTYKTWAIVSNVPTSVAYKNIYLKTVKDGWNITSSDKDMGIISAAQSVSYGNGKTAPLNIIVEQENESDSKVSITYSTSGGVSSPEDAVLKSFCETVSEAEK